VNRRLVGGLVLLVAVLATLIVPVAAGRTVAGSAVPQVVPQPPVVGDCVRSISPLPPTPAGGADDAPIVYPTVEYGTCGGPIVREVMSVDSTRKALGKATVASYQSAGSACELSEVNYVGSIGPFDPATITTPGMAW
jgi:hypothetical protein